MTLLTKQEAATILRMSVSGLNKILKARRISYSKNGKNVVIDMKDLEKYVERNKIKTA